MISIGLLAGALSGAGCADELAGAQPSGFGGCVEVDRQYTPGARPGDAGRVRVIQRRVRCTDDSADPTIPPFESDVAAYRHLARTESFPVDVVLTADPDQDPAETEIARYRVPSEYFYPNNPLLMQDIADGEVRSSGIQFFAVFRDGQYVSQVDANNTVVQSVHTFKIIAGREDSSLSEQISWHTTDPEISQYYVSQGPGEIGLELFHFISDPGPLLDQRWLGTTSEGDPIMVNCSPQYLLGESAMERRHEYGLCRLIFEAEPRVRVTLSFPHSQLSIWRDHWREALELLDAWRTH